MPTIRMFASHHFSEVFHSVIRRCAWNLNSRYDNA